MKNVSFMAILAVAALVILLAAVVLIIIIMKKAERFSRSVFGTKSLAEGLYRQSEALAETPKSVSGMTRIYEPQLCRDFPEFQWKEFRDKAERQLIMAFAAISSARENQIFGCSESFKEQITSRIKENKRQQIREVYEDVQIHNTEITKYEKKNGTCILTLQSAVGYIHYKERDGRLLEGSREQVKQTKYNIQLMYIQDARLANGNHAVGITCPSCGAPVVNLGQKSCEYCGLPVIPVNAQVWSIQGFFEVDYHNV